MIDTTGPFVTIPEMRTMLDQMFPTFREWLNGEQLPFFTEKERSRLVRKARARGEEQGWRPDEKEYSGLRYLCFERAVEKLVEAAQFLFLIHNTEHPICVNNGIRYGTQTHARYPSLQFERETGKFRYGYGVRAPDPEKWQGAFRARDIDRAFQEIFGEKWNEKRPSAGRGRKPNLLVETRLRLTRELAKDEWSSISAKEASIRIADEGFQPSLSTVRRALDRKK